ncbi:alpha/beta fold hydrolase [Ekhidna sp.]|uniref:alpha/beta fold hydrolase n=1 Tax=Ekhidna sp. TaxID=2608089 RepID=UPI003CCBB2E8
MIVSLIKKIFHQTYLPEIVKKDSIVESSYFDVNEDQQWVYARGESRNNPLLLFLHPGPGFVATGITNGYQSLLEKHFIVIHWHMRGAGKSYSKAVSTKEMSIDSLVDDTLDLSQQLIKKYQKSDLYIMGHSFGSLIALKSIKNKPEIFRYFISVAQMTDVSEMEKKSYDFVMESATENEDTSVLKSLKKISRTVDNLTIEGIKKKQELIHSYGGCAPGFKNIVELLTLLIINPVEHSFSDVIKCFKGLQFSGSQLFKEACEINFFKEIDKVEIPVLMVLGENDQISNPQLVKLYFDHLQAPKKELIELKGDAHFPFLSQPEVFQSEILKALNIQ